MTRSVYFIGAFSGDDIRYIKIGTTEAIKGRLVSMQTATPYTLKPLLVVPGGFAAEGWLHWFFAPHHLAREWYSPSAEMMQFIAEANRRNRIPNLPRDHNVVNYRKMRGKRKSPLRPDLYPAEEKTA